MYICKAVYKPQKYLRRALFLMVRNKIDHETVHNQEVKVKETNCQGIEGLPQQAQSPLEKSERISSSRNWNKSLSSH